MDKPTPAAWIICGLGNPGLRYARTRHNAGFRVLDRLAAAHRIILDPQPSLPAELGEGTIAGTSVILVRPLTFMNRSGSVIPPLRDRAGGDVFPRFLAIVDDLDLPLGKIRIRRAGSSGGQKGLASLIECLGTDDFPRIRIGIGRPPEGMDGAEYVLGVPATEEEQTCLDRAESQAAEAVVTILSEGIAAAMNRFHASQEECA